MPRSAGEWGQNLSSRERQGRPSTAMCTALAFPFTECPATESLGSGGKPKGSRVSAMDLAAALGVGCSGGGHERVNTLCWGPCPAPAEPPTAQVYLINWRGLGCPDCSSSSPNKRSRQDLRPSKKTSCPRSLAAVRLTPLREENVTLQSEQLWRNGANRTKQIDSQFLSGLIQMH